MRRTLLLVFIHGFKGGDDTFANFPEHLRALVSHTLPNIDVTTVTYPKFETRGELKDCVDRFRSWLTDKVIDLEVGAGNTAATIDPSVHVMLIGHSMGGIVAAEALIQIANDKPIPRASAPDIDHNFPSNITQAGTTSTSRPIPTQHPHAPKPPPENDQQEPDLSPASFMFPHIQGLLAFDTPFLGLAPSMISANAENHLQTASSAYKAFNEISAGFGWSGKAASPAKSPGASTPKGMLPAPSNTGDAAATPKWQSWGKYAMFAGAAGAIAAGGAAAVYSQKEKLSEGWKFATSHLEFVGCLAKGEDLKKRIENVGQIRTDRGIGAANFYTRLGGEWLEQDRTFCNLPEAVKRNQFGSDKDKNQKKIGEGKEDGLKWYMALNSKAKSEITAHTGMFVPKENPEFFALGTKARDVIQGWVDLGWYKHSDAQPNGASGGGRDMGEVGEGWVKPDYESADVKTKQVEKEEHVNANMNMNMNMNQDWEGLDGAKEWQDDVKMTDEDSEDKENSGLKSSVLIDKAD